MINPLVSISCMSGQEHPDGFNDATLRFKEIKECIDFSHSNEESYLLVRSDRGFELHDFKNFSVNHQTIRILIIQRFVKNVLDMGMYYMDKKKMHVDPAPDHLLVVALRPRNNLLSEFKETLETEWGFQFVKKLSQRHPENSDREFVVWVKNVDVVSERRSPSKISPQPIQASKSQAKRDVEKKLGFWDRVWELIKWLFCVRYCKKTKLAP